jgi:hypothetical protein
MEDAFIVIGIIVAIWLILRIWVRYFSSLDSNSILQFVSDIDSKGFEVYKGYEAFKQNKPQKFLWKEIDYLKLDDRNHLLIKPFEGKQIELREKCGGWFKLLTQIPKSKQKDPQVSDYLAEIFSKLETCKGCGRIAFKNNECLNCGIEAFDDELKQEFETEIEYIRDEQLEYFGTDDGTEKVEFYLEENEVFQLDKNWKPIVTEEEVIAYSQENYWD